MQEIGRRALVATLTTTALLLGSDLHAQSYPSKPITIVVPFPAGAGMDAVARALAEKLEKRLGQSVVVDNRAGATGIIGTRYVARGPQDGHTLLFAGTSLSFAQMVVKTAPSNGYDALNDFVPIIEIGRTPVFLVTNAASGFQSFQDAALAAKSKRLDYGSAGSGSSNHIIGEIVNKATGVNFAHVPYKGTAPAMTDLLGGHIPFAYVALSTIKPYAGSGKLVTLAVTSGQRTKLAPEVPTLSELGYKGVDHDTWYGLFGPRGMPPEAVKILNTHLNEILQLPDVVKVMADQGTTVAGGTPEALGRVNVADFERWGKTIKEMGIQAD
jgi:tripartite-type tricarboxylate transporter receptor subunit TctC